MIFINKKNVLFVIFVILIYIASLNSIYIHGKCYKITNSSSPITPQILDYKILNQSSNILMNSSGSFYIYTAVDGGGISISNYNFNVIGYVTDGNSVDSALTGYSHINNGSYDHYNAAAYAIAGIAVGSTSGINNKLNAYYNYSVNGTPDATSATLNFSVNTSNSLVVIVAAGSTETSAKINGNFNIKILDSLYSSTLSLIQGYSVLNAGNYYINTTMTPLQGQNVNPDGVGIILAVYVFSPSYFYLPSKYNVNFVESGLPMGTIWSVTLNNITHSSQNNVIQFTEYNGSYQYRISMADNMIPNPGYGNIFVNGSSLNVSVEFMPPGKYMVTFQPEGLNPNDGYSVTIDNSTQNAYGNQTITFSLINGTYSYKIGFPSGYIVYPQSGIVSVSGKNVILKIFFMPKQYRITIIENGLPPGTLWWVTFKGQNYTSTSQEINISAPDGNYAIYFSSPQGYAPDKNYISVEINNSNSTVKVLYSYISPSNISFLNSPTYLLVISLLLFIVLALFVFVIFRGVKNVL